MEWREEGRGDSPALRSPSSRSFAAAPRSIVAVINTVISLFYYLLVLAPMYFSKPEGNGGAAQRQRRDRSRALGLAVMGIGLGAGALPARFHTATLLP